MDRETLQHKDNKGIQNIIMEFFENLYFIKFGNLKENNNIVDSSKPPKKRPAS